MTPTPASDSKAPTEPFLVIAGPTAVGKSAVALEVADRCGGEIIGADAFQVYAGLRVLTAQPSAEELARVPHHLVSEIPLSRSFDVAQFVAAARERLAAIRARGRVAIVCGGTGLYVRALMRGIAELPAANADLRAELEAQPLAQMQRRLAELDPVGFAQLDIRNPRRVIRALEVCLLTGRPFSSFRQEWDRAETASRGVVLTRDREDLHCRINQRTEGMFAAGVEDEVRALRELGPTAEQVIGLRDLRRLEAGEITHGACVSAIQQATRRYAKRQLTWFRQEPALTTVNLSVLANREALIAGLVEQATALLPR
ncbi:MAG: tRNA dimethylallyltransferase [Chthoniobacter sp.]|nr:tRNA dimethylallyltransferase [Chthoniobacter sp.]